MLSVHGEGFAFLKYHFTDMLAPIAVLSYAGLLLKHIKGDSIRSAALIFVLYCGFSFVLEYCAKFFDPGSTSDWMDVLCIFGGGLIYWLIINLLKQH